MTLSVEKDVDLTSLNSFGVRAKAAAMVFVSETQHVEALPSLLAQYPAYLILGGGSNILFRDNFPGLVIVPEFRKLEYIEASENSVLLTAGSRVSWHELVSDTCERGLSGLENLALIPGTVGAAPIQNIGAYGVELKDCFVSLRAYDLQENCWQEFSLADCKFGYRDSIFKQKLGRYLITQVTLKLSRQFQPKLNYQPLANAFSASDLAQLNPKTVMSEVINIRQSKLPDPTKLGNAGSFFKNPVVNEEQFRELEKQFPTMVYYRQADNRVKLAAGWLIDQLGLKGFSVGGAAVHEQQALVIVNQANATGNDVIGLAKEIKKRVKQTYGIELEAEVRIVP